MKNANKRLKIAFVTARDAKERGSWSGIHYYMAQALQKHCGDVHYVGPIKPKLETVAKVFNKASLSLLKKIYSYTHSLVFAKEYAQFIGSKLSALAPDLIFAPIASTEIAFLDATIPIIYTSDVTFALANNYFPWFKNLLNLSIREGNIVEQLALQKASLILYPTEWAAQSAIKDYRADAAKIHVIPLGANLEEIPPKEAILQKKKSDRCRLLFLAARWQGKGGDIAFETLLKLEELGVQAELTICGCNPPKGFSHRRMTVVPFLNKKDERQRQELSRLLLASDFLLLPTRFECFGIVFCEANAFGLPAITTDTGGVSGVIKNGENGFTLPFTAGGSDYANLIAMIYQEDQRYYELVRSSRAAFDDRLNWDAWAIAVKKLIAELI